MNYRMSLYLLGQISITIACTLVIPLALSLGYQETGTPIWFSISIAILLSFGIPSVVKKPKDTNMKAKGGFITVAIAWIWLSAVTCLPFILSGVLPNFFDAFFEIVSGFTTTGATVLTNIEIVPKSLLFWRSFTNWLGGMGILVFLVAVMPKTDNSFVQVYKAEVPGMSFGKMVSKLRFTARILYAIYIFLTILLFIFLVSGGMPVFDSIIHTFSSAGTGGFSNKNLSIAAYNNIYFEIVITVFLLLFAMNFEVYFLVLIGHLGLAFKKEELRALFAIYFVSVISITASLFSHHIYPNFGETLRYSSFQVASLMSTTGFTTTDYTTWPLFTQLILLILMVIGGSSSSTAGGIKISRFITLAKTSIRDIRKTISPRTVKNVKYDGKIMTDDLTSSVTSFFVIYMAVFVISVALISATNTLSGGEGFLTYTSAVIACLSNTGPGLSLVGPAYNYSFFSGFSKIILSLNMLLGRLELYPILFLFYHKAWKRY
ncbi:MAG: Trk system potassium uptake protein TrkG [Firmicutes bacterium ADurb.Bin080]|jgi:trk system potassium uptake protein|nr:TrkH family potassium uptake protein [Clostridiales bacterium]OQC14039.1 MAG: Trk system potassium uptake protein TrkG [Firmicutes bacterium ADurb.Bin080]